MQVPGLLGQRVSGDQRGPSGTQRWRARLAILSVSLSFNVYRLLPLSVPYRLPLVTVYRFLPLTVADRLQLAAFAMARPGPARTPRVNCHPPSPFASVYR